MIAPLNKNIVWLHFRTTFFLGKASSHILEPIWLISIIHLSHMTSIQPLNFSPTHNSLAYLWFISPLISRWMIRMDHVVINICEKSMFRSFLFSEVKKLFLLCIMKEINLRKWYSKMHFIDYRLQNRRTNQELHHRSSKDIKRQSGVYM